MSRQLIAGNWKMNGLLGPGSALAKDLAARASAGTPAGVELLVCPPAPLLFPLAEILKGTGIALGGQDCHAEARGAHTGDISAEMLADAGCTYAIVGHSERRADHGESDAEVKAKAGAARGVGLTPIVCVGETGDQRSAGETLSVIEAQVKGSVPEDFGAGGLVVAYEPVWAIGSGLTAKPADVREVHGHIRGLLTALFGPEAGAAIRILYGGSVKPANAAELLAVPDVDGALVGGASLSAEDFWAIAAT
jgi:triosephosphate isomerase (TIM)